MTKILCLTKQPFTAIRLPFVTSRVAHKFSRTVHGERTTVIIAMRSESRAHRRQPAASSQQPEAIMRLTKQPSKPKPYQALSSLFKLYQALSSLSSLCPFPPILILSAFKTTETELAAMAAPAIIGERTPSAASGMPMAL